MANQGDIPFCRCSGMATVKEEEEEEEEEVTRNTASDHCFVEIKSERNQSLPESSTHHDVIRNSQDAHHHHVEESNIVCRPTSEAVEKTVELGQTCFTNGQLVTATSNDVIQHTLAVDSNILSDTNDVIHQIRTGEVIQLTRSDYVQQQTPVDGIMQQTPANDVQIPTPANDVIRQIPTDAATDVSLTVQTDQTIEQNTEQQTDKKTMQKTEQQTEQKTEQKTDQTTEQMTEQTTEQTTEQHTEQQTEQQMIEHETEHERDGWMMVDEELEGRVEVEEGGPITITAQPWEWESPPTSAVEVVEPASRKWAGCGLDGRCRACCRSSLFRLCCLPFVVCLFCFGPPGWLLVYLVFKCREDRQTEDDMA